MFSARLLTPISFFGIDSEGKLFRRQGLAVRTNCLDCLDRTNLMQVIFFVFVQATRDLNTFSQSRKIFLAELWPFRRLLILCRVTLPVGL